MQVPLGLNRKADGKLSYGMPLWYRIVMLVISSFLIASIVSSGEGSVVGWIILGLCVVGFLYEERWVFDPKTRAATYSCGIFPVLKHTKISFEEISFVHIDVIARGTQPGGEQERLSIEATLSGPGTLFDKTTERMKRRSLVRLLMESKDGQVFLIDTVGHRSVQTLKKMADAISAMCEIEQR